MDIKLVCPVIILENELNPNVRKNDIKKFKLLVDNDDNLVSVTVENKSNLKKLLRNKLKNIINSDIFHLEQVYALGEEKYYLNDSVDIIYLAITNVQNIKELDNNYKLVDFAIKNNEIKIDNTSYQFKTIENISNNNVEYYHEINIENIELEKKILEIIISYKQLRNKLDNSDIIFKFMPKYFTLEDVRIVYEMIKEITVDKSNFRKKVIKYCVEANTNSIKKGYRPSKLYTFNVLKGDVWL